MSFPACWTNLGSVAVILLASLWSRGISQDVPVERKVAAPGSNILLSCSFPVEPNMNNESLIINWQYGTDTVVHSFYRLRDQLDKQHEVYKGRTSLFHDQLQSGDASLMLTDVQPEHNGEYKCYVTCNNRSYVQKLQLLIAALYDEPEIAIQYHCENVVASLSSSNGFPKPAVTWFSSLGEAVTTLTLDSRGRYRLESNFTLSLNTTQTVRVEMSLDELSQKISRTLTLHPQPVCCEGEIPRCRIGFGIALVLIIPALIMLLFYCKQ